MDIKGKKDYQDIGDAVGMPDETDKQNIRKIILKYEHNHPGEIKQTIEEMKMYSKHLQNEYGLVGGKAKSGVVGGSGLRFQLALPPGLHAKIEEYIPTIFRSKKHYHWFLKNFKELTLTEKV